MQDGLAATDAAAGLELLRRQRHDFLNHLQVMSGLLQLGRADQALAYLRRVAKEVEDRGALLRLRYPRLALALLRLEMEAEGRHSEVRFALDAEGFEAEVDEDKLVGVVRAVGERVIAALRPDQEELLIIRLEAGERRLRLTWEVYGPGGRPGRELLGELRGRIRASGAELRWLEGPGAWKLELSFPTPA